MQTLVQQYVVTQLSEGQKKTISELASCNFTLYYMYYGRIKEVLKGKPTAHILPLPNKLILYKLKWIIYRKTLFLFLGKQMFKVF